MPTVPATALVVFGATGDLARRKLLPALYNLAAETALPEHFALVGVARGAVADVPFRSMADEAIRRFSRRPPDDAVVRALLEDVFALEGDFDHPGTYIMLGRRLEALDAAHGEPLNRCFYLSTAPAFFATIAERLGEHGLACPEHADVGLVVEKPFGTSLAEARELNRRLLDVFEERQVFRIDHYLGKETVQNLLALRFANRLFEPVWNRNYVEYVQITAAEEIGIGTRAGYYDGVGALRDLVQNHLLQLLCLVAMDPPARFAAEETRNEKVKVLRSILPPPPDEAASPSAAVRAQYDMGIVGGEPVPGYRDEEGVPPDSRTETYAALRLEVDNWRWAGVPFYLRTGKRLMRRKTEITVSLKAVPHLPFAATGGSIGVQPNHLILAIQPDEGVSLTLAAKVPGATTTMRLRPVLMQYVYTVAFPSESPEAYERLVLDVMRGDPMLFTRDDEVEAQWQICDPVLRAWGADAAPLARYPAGTQGPAEAAGILFPGHSWRRI
jgi:glucose-6-phosphate 1-dehydrogenase